MLAEAIETLPKETQPNARAFAVDSATLTRELKAVLHDAGAALVGVGSLESVKGCEWPVGVSVAVRLPVHIVQDLLTAPTVEYGDAYDSLNGKLNDIVTAGEQFLTARGFRAYARTTSRVTWDENGYGTDLPHKTVATRAGLGWIGKSCLLVTPEYGSAVRISSLVTDAPLETVQAIDESRCGTCRQCVRHCPAQALYDTLWRVGIERDGIVNARACDQKMYEISAREGITSHALCGMCIAVCPYTRRSVKRDVERLAG